MAATPGSIQLTFKDEYGDVPLIYPTYQVTLAMVGTGYQNIGGALYNRFVYNRPEFNATPDQIQEFMVLDWLTRPPLEDEEIRLMPANEVIGLYYNLRRLNPDFNAGGYLANPVVSRGLPAPYDWAHDTDVQQRIYNLRPDLHFLTNPGNNVTYPVLIDPNKLGYDTGETTLETAAIVAAGVATILLPAFGLIIQAIVQAALIGLNAAAKADALARAAKATGLVQQILYGVATLQDYGETGHPQTTDVASLSVKRQQWKAMLADYGQRRNDIIAQASGLPYPNRWLTHDNPASYAFVPYQPFLFSTLVAQAVDQYDQTTSVVATSDKPLIPLPGTPPTLNTRSNVGIKGGVPKASPTSIRAKPPAQAQSEDTIGVGLLALLLLL